MKDKLKAIITGNLPLKLIGLILAVALWLVLSNAQDPLVSRTVTVPIVYDESGLATDNLIAISKPASVTIPVMVRKSRMRTLSAGDFTVAANLTDTIGEVMDAPEGTKVLLQITKSQSAAYIEDWEYPQSQNYITVVLDKVKTSTYAIGFNLTKELAAGYQLGTLAAEPTKVTVTGPTSSFSSLAAVKAVIDQSRITESTTNVEAELGLFDGNNRQLSGSGLELSQSTVNVSVSLVQSKEVSVSVAGYSGTPAEGYMVSKIDYSPKLVTICGSKNALSNVSTVSIPSSELDITGASSTKEFTIDITPYLGNDVALAEEMSSNVTVTIEFEQLETESFMVDTSLFTLANTSDDYDYEILTKEVNIQVSAFKDDLDYFGKNLSESINAQIDVTGLKAGEYTLPVNLMLESAYILQNDVSVSVRVTDWTEVESSEAETEINEAASEVETEKAQESSVR